MYLYFNLWSSFTDKSPIEKGGVFDLLMRISSFATSSNCPVDKSLFIVSSDLCLIIPVTSITYSLLSDSAILKSSDSSGLKTICIILFEDLKSTNITPP